jgi:hypothetical protein
LEAEDAFFAAGVAASRRNYRAAKVWPKDELSPLDNDRWTTINDALSGQK